MELVKQLNRFRSGQRFSKACPFARSFVRNNSSVPDKAIKIVQSSNSRIDASKIRQLERVSLVAFDDEGAIQRLEAAVKFAEPLRKLEIDEAVKPLYTVLKNEKLRLREDQVTEGNCPNEILQNAQIIEDDYFVAPPGNIPWKLNFVTLNKAGFCYGAQGQLFARNVENAWFRQCITKPAYNVFLTTSDKATETMNYLKMIHVDALPLGLAALENSKLKCKQETFHPEENAPITHKIAKVVVFNDANSSKNAFQAKQRERKVWWRKLACQPSRFVLSEVKKSKSNEVVDILARFAFGDVVVESIKLSNDVQKYFPKDTNESLADVKAVEHVAFLDWGCLALLCDGYKEVGEDSRLQLHPKISPHKATFVAAKSDEDLDSVEEDLKELIVYLNNSLRLGGIDTILTHDERSLKAFQVPFIVNVDKTSLKNGIIHVSNQFTTLAESVHITKLVEHIASRCS